MIIYLLLVVCYFALIAAWFIVCPLCGLCCLLKRHVGRSTCACHCHGRKS